MTPTAPSASPAVDMSAGAITRRLEPVRALYRLMVSLRGIAAPGATARGPGDADADRAVEGAADGDPGPVAG